MLFGLLKGKQKTLGIIDLMFKSLKNSTSKIEMFDLFSNEIPFK